MTVVNESFAGDLSAYQQLFSTAAAISGGQLVGTVAASVGIVHTGSFGADQSSEFLVQSTAANFYYSAITRCVWTSAGNWRGYQGSVGVASGDAYLEVVTAGAGTEIVTSGSLGRALTTSDVIYLESIGSTHTLKVNGSTLLTATDSTYASGKPGVGMYSSGALDNAEFQDYASGAYTLTAEQGTYTVSGQAAGVVAGRLLTAAQGSYALSGQDATLTALGSYTLTAEHGTYTITGSAALAQYSLTAEHGVYSISGQDATLVPPAGAYTLTAEYGAYIIAGQDATLIPPPLTYSMAADYGVFNISGQNAVLRYGSSATGRYVTKIGLADLRIGL